MSNTDPNSIVVDTEPANGNTTPVAGDVGDGFLGGNVQQPAISRRRTGDGQSPPPQPIATNGAATFTAADLEAAREQEKSKLYNRLEAMESQFSKMETERQAALDAAAAAEQAAEDARKGKELEEMDLRTRLETMAEETQKRFLQLEEDRKTAEAMLEQERTLSSLVQYRDKQMREYGSQIMPQLQDFVVGNSPEEIDAAIVAMVERTNSIVNDVQAAQNQNFSSMRGAGVTAPMGSPQDVVPQEQTFTAKQIREMSPQTYAQHQAQLREAAKRQFYSGR